MKKIPLKIWFFLFSLGVLGTTLLTLSDASAGQADFLRYSRDRVPLEQAILRYHNDMNSLFNDHIEKLFSVTPEKSRYTVAPPEDKDCSDRKNISTFCLAMRAVDVRDAFVQGIETHRNFLKDKEDDSNPTLSQLTGRLDRRLELINEQVAVSERVMSAALASYDQLQIFYPLHVQYRDLIGSLEGYRDGLADVRREVEKYPGSFHNITTTECT